MNQKTLKWGDGDTRGLAVATLKRAGVILSTTDTVVGLLALADKQGYQALNALKGRENKPYIVLVGSLEALADVVKLPLAPAVQALVCVCWPGPVTLVLPAKPGLPSCICSDGTIGVRLPAHEGLRYLAGECGPLFSTSANLAGMPVPKTIAGVHPAILNAVSLIITDEHEGEVASTVLDCTHDPIKVLREGACSSAELSSRAGVPIIPKQ